MNEAIQDKIKQSMLAAEAMFYRLVLLVGGTGSGKTGALRELAGNLETAVINVNLALARELLELTAKQRPLRCQAILDRIAEQAPSPALLDNIEILFDQDLRQDPLRLLQGISRNRVVVASWNGTFDGKRLFYAIPEHPEYRSYDPGDTLIVGMDGASVVH